MEKVELRLNEKGHGAFYIADGETQVGEMVVSINQQKLTVYHTEVAPEAEGKGLAKEMLQAMAAYARQHQLHVIPLCSYVHAQFKRHPDEYADIWNKES